MPRPADPPPARQAPAQTDDHDGGPLDDDAARRRRHHHRRRPSRGQGGAAAVEDAVDGPPPPPPGRDPAPPAAAAAASSGHDRSREGAGAGEGRGLATAAPRLLQPRVAVVLGVRPAWHPVLFASRLLSVVPAVWWGLPSSARFLARLGALALASGQPLEVRWSFENRLRLTESLLAIIWCGCSAYLSFFFTDCLMSRWLLNYTPPATIVRLLAINALNGYVTSWVLWLAGGSGDPRLLLPSWIGIATTLTVIYHITQRKINIRKETSTSISVFSIASFISMVSLLAQLHLGRSDYPDVPLIRLARLAWHEAGRAAVSVLEYANVTKEL